MKSLLAVPNISEGRERETIEAIRRAFAAQAPSGGHSDREAGARVVDVHSDCDHHRSVFTLAGAPGQLAEAVAAGAAVAVERVDIRDGRGVHPHVGAVDVAPIVYLSEKDRGAAAAEALVLGEAVGQLGVPVVLYGELAGGRTRAELRRGGVEALAGRIASGEVVAEFGPQRAHPTAGVTLVGARGPLVAFNLVLEPPAGVEVARSVAAAIREGGVEGLPGVRAIGVELTGGRGQVSMNVERPGEVPLRAVVEAVRRHAEVAEGELVGLAPRVAFEGMPEDLRLVGFDERRHVVENALGSGVRASGPDRTGAEADGSNQGRTCRRPSADARPSTGATPPE